MNLVHNVTAILINALRYLNRDQLHSLGRAIAERSNATFVINTKGDQPPAGEKECCGGKRYIVSYRSANGYAVIDQATGDAVKCWLSASDAIALCDRLNSEHSPERANNGRMNEEA